MPFISIIFGAVFFRVILGALLVLLGLGSCMTMLEGSVLSVGDIPDAIQVVRINQGPHDPPGSRHGEVVTVTLHNSDTSHSTRARYTAGNLHDAPLWLGCLLSNGRLVAFPLDWVNGPQGPVYPTLAPNSTLTVDFRTKLELLEDPVSPSDRIQECKVGGSQWQANRLYPF